MIHWRGGPPPTAKYRPRAAALLERFLREELHRHLRNVKYVNGEYKIYYSELKRYFEAHGLPGAAALISLTANGYLEYVLLKLGFRVRRGRKYIVVIVDGREEGG
ncbi:hypothetical protein [Vulcanisaeta sp. JCM 14467]|uniref:hypothetical protein n=1 Tax=Vulcanisaeta sp. JCM 14467 TaxID=1295370 RepID=UPI002092C3BB|nr:hypothetical protein [Vulcanisaeta sp. JCM 14467]